MVTIYNASKIFNAREMVVLVANGRWNGKGFETLLTPTEIRQIARK